MTARCRGPCTRHVVARRNVGGGGGAGGGGGGGGGGGSGHHRPPPPPARRAAKSANRFTNYDRETYVKGGAAPLLLLCGGGQPREVRLNNVLPCLLFGQTPCDHSRRRRRRPPSAIGGAPVAGQPPLTSASLAPRSCATKNISRRRSRDCRSTRKVQGEPAAPNCESAVLVLARAPPRCWLCGDWRA